MLLILHLAIGCFAALSALQTSNKSDGLKVPLENSSRYLVSSLVNTNKSCRKLMTSCLMASRLNFPFFCNSGKSYFLIES